MLEENVGYAIMINYNGLKTRLLCHAMFLLTRWGCRFFLRIFHKYFIRYFCLLCFNFVLTLNAQEMVDYRMEFVFTAASRIIIKTKVI